MAGLATSTVMLSGCAAKQEANDTLPPVAAAPSASEAALPSLGPPDLPMPDDARTQDAAGAQAFVRYYIDLINRTSTVLDAAPLREFSDGCRDCSRIATNVEEDAAAGRDYEGGEITITQLLTPVMRDGEASIPLYVSQVPLTVHDPSGAPIEDLSSTGFPETFSGIGLQWNEDLHTWVMQDFTIG
jgi:hypothetical protein